MTSVKNLIIKKNSINLFLYLIKKNRINVIRKKNLKSFYRKFNLLIDHLMMNHIKLDFSSFLKTKVIMNSLSSGTDSLRSVSIRSIN